MEEKLYGILRKHKLPLKKREALMDDLLNLFSVSGWLEVHGNERLFKEYTKKNCPCRFIDGTQSLYNEYLQKSNPTHFKIKW